MSNTTKPLLEEVFGNNRVCAIAGDKSTGKTNNLAALARNFRKFNKTTQILVYGVEDTTLRWLRNLGNVFEISSLSQLSNKKDCLIFIDEFQRLNLNNRRYRHLLDETINFIYHNNNWVIFCSPNLREYNSVIGSKIERWLLKSLRLSSLVNGSQLKDIVLAYNGRFKSIEDIDIKKNQLLIINSEYEKVIDLEYIQEIDEKLNKINIFDMYGNKNL